MQVLNKKYSYIVYMSGPAARASGFGWKTALIVSDKPQTQLSIVRAYRKANPNEQSMYVSHHENDIPQVIEP